MLIPEIQSLKKAKMLPRPLLTSKGCWIREAGHGIARRQDNDDYVCYITQHHNTFLSLVRQVNLLASILRLSLLIPSDFTPPLMYSPDVITRLMWGH